MFLCALIPAYNPGEVVTGVIEQTLDHVDHLILIDDGCDYANAQLLNDWKEHPKVTLLKHQKNLGKGHALYSGFQYFLTMDCPYLVMLDSDGQHDPEEIVVFKQYVEASAPDFVIGIRTDINQMPLKSKIGNVVMSKLFRLITGIKLVDTQSGFRMLSRSFVRCFLNQSIPGRYETEMRMLFLAAKKEKAIVQIPIKTTYIDGNLHSKFRPLNDSILVLATFVKFAGVGLMSFVFDYLLYLMLLTLGVGFLRAHLFSRVFSGVFNFAINKKMVFKDKSSVLKSASKYMLAAAFSLAISSLLLWLMVDQLTWQAVWSKPVAEILTFVVNFFVIKHFVFKPRNVFS